MKPSITAADIVVEGRVQGVGYRAHVERHAARLGLAGYVMNLDDGRVLTHVEGDRALIEALVAVLEQGPSLARVARTEVHWMEPTHRYSSFRIRSAGADS